jgi:acetyl esterase/lipase
MKHFWLIAFFCPMLGFAQTVFPLYENEIPNSIPTKNEEYADTTKEGILIIHKISQPSITVFPAPQAKANGTGVIIFPGGGYWIVAAGHEGYEVAKKFNEMGITAFVVKYRIPNDATMPNREIGPLQDAQRAIQWVREKAKNWQVNPQKIGIMGFSAGGHLASTAGTHFQKNYIANPNKTNLRPDFMILVYPVISFIDSIGHLGSREQILGKSPSSEKIKEYSNELQVGKKTPPTFLVHAKDDEAVKVQNSILFAEALAKFKVKNDIFLYKNGGHGFGMHNPTSPIKWMDLVKEWLKKNKWVKE